MNTHNHVHLLATWFAGVLMLLNTTNLLAVTPACNAILPGNMTTTLDSNMVCTGRAIRFRSGSDNAILDCDNLTISNSSGRVIDAISVSGITIKNCVISTAHAGGRAIQWTEVTNSEISGNNISTTGGGSAGISLRGHSNSNQIFDNMVHTTGLSSRGLRLNAINSNNNSVTSNTFQADNSYAVGIRSSSGNQLTGNTYISPIGDVIQGLEFMQNGGMSVDAAGTIYAVENNWGSSAGGGLGVGSLTAFFKVDPVTGAAHSVIPLVDDVGDDVGIGFDALEILPNGRVLTFTGPDSFGDFALAEIDPATGELTELVPTSVPLSLTGKPNGLEAISDTVVLFTTNQGELGSFDPTTGVVTEIGEQGIGWTGLAIEPGTGTAYTVSRQGGEASRTAHLYTIDVTDGTMLSHIGDTGQSVISDIDFSPDGTLYGNLDLVVIDINTGLGTTKGSFGGDPLEPASQNNNIENNVWPTNPIQVSPVNGATGLDTSVTFVWNIVTNPDGGNLDYQFSLCEDFGFAGCAPATVVASVEKNTDYASVEGLLPLVLFGTVLGSIGFRRRKWLMMLAVSLAMIGLVSNCGGGGGGVVDVDPCSGSVSVSATEVELPVTCLKPATTYYWKVSVSDGIGTIESSIASFTTL